jgi:ABC-type phosphate/phosphonate transport system substrate-binding protein
MNKALSRTIACLFLFALPTLLPARSLAEQLRIAFTQDQKNVVQKYQPLMDYMAKRGIVSSYEEVKDYPSAATLFASGGVDAMFCGSGVAGALMISELAVPLVRPVTMEGHSTYWTVILAPQGSPAYTGSAEYFKGKKVAFTGLASAGEFYFNALPPAAKAGSKPLLTDSHGDAIDAVARGEADVAIVKNRVWDSVRNKYPQLAMVGEDKGENPDGTLIVSANMPVSLMSKISADLLALQNDPTPEAQAAKSSMKIAGFIRTTGKDFEHTLALLRRAGVTRNFMFARNPLTTSAAH